MAFFAAVWCAAVLMPGGATAQPTHSCHQAAAASSRVLELIAAERSASSVLRRRPLAAPSALYAIASELDQAAHAASDMRTCRCFRAAHAYRDGADDVADAMDRGFQGINVDTKAVLAAAELAVRRALALVNAGGCDLLADPDAICRPGISTRVSRVAHNLSRWSNGSQRTAELFPRPNPAQTMLDNLAYDAEACGCHDLARELRTATLAGMPSTVEVSALASRAAAACPRSG